MTAKALFVSFPSAASAHTPLPAYKTVDGHYVSYVEGQAALRSGQALLIGELLIGSYPVARPIRL